MGEPYGKSAAFCVTKHTEMAFLWTHNDSADCPDILPESRKVLNKPDADLRIMLVEALESPRNAPK